MTVETTHEDPSERRRIVETPPTEEHRNLSAPRTSAHTFLGGSDLQNLSFPQNTR
jgi:hypothetical protein